MLFFATDGTVKSTGLDKYRIQKRKGTGIAAINAGDEGTYPRFVAQVNSHDRVMMVTDQGNRYFINAYDVPSTNRGNKGRPVADYVDAFEDGEKVIAAFPMRRPDHDATFVVVCRNGLLKRLSLDTLYKMRESTTKIQPVEETGPIACVKIVDPSDDIFIASAGGRLLRTKMSAVREMSNRLGKGIISLVLGDDDHVVGFDTVSDEDEILFVGEKGYGKRTDASNFMTKGRRGKGATCYGSGEGNRLVLAATVRPEQELMLATDHNKVIRISVSEIKQIASPRSRGLSLKRMEGDETVTTAVCF